MAEESIIFWIGLGAVLLGGGVMVSSVFQLIRALRCRGWDRCEGEVLETEVRSMGGGGPHSHRSNKGSWQPIVRYCYTWRGREFESDRRIFGDYSASKERAEEIIGRYKAGQSVEVFVNPMEPDMAVLEARLTRGLLLAPLIATFFIGVGLVVLYRGG